MSKVLLYIAGPSSEYKRVRPWANAVDKTGHIEISHRWFDTAHEWTGKDGGKPREEQAQFAGEELDAIARSHIVWVMWPNGGKPSSCTIEMGAALMLARLPILPAGMRAPYVIVTGPAMANPNPFTALANYRDIPDSLGFHETVRVANQMVRKGHK